MYDLSKNFTNTVKNKDDHDILKISETDEK